MSDSEKIFDQLSDIEEYSDLSGDSDVSTSQ